MSAGAIGAIVGGAWGMFSTVQAQKAAAEEADRKRAEEIYSAKSMYSSVEDSTNIMKSVAREQSANAINEALRAGMAQNTEVKKEIQQVASKQLANSEGLTSGRSRGRAMVSTYIKGNQAIAKSNSQTASVINSITEQKDKIQNDMNNRLLSAHQEMAAILTTPSNPYKADWTQAITAGLQGAQSGASMASSLSGAFGGASSGGIADSIAGYGKDQSNISGPRRPDGYL